jgi:hypothetical protein
MIMVHLLKNDFTAHYNLPTSTINDIAINTNEIYFELEDSQDRNTVLYTEVGKGTAKYSNPNKRLMTIINYDKFFTSLSHKFQKGKKRCDLIVYSNDKKYFLLNELKNRSPRDDVRQGAIKQLTESLKVITSVKSIYDFINEYNIKQCCIFNKQPDTETSEEINAVNTFNRQNKIDIAVVSMLSPIKSLGLKFELLAFSDNQIYLLEDKLTGLKAIAGQLTKLSTKEVKELTEILQSKIEQR